MIIKHQEISASELRKKVRNRQICFGGNAALKIFGLLSCKSGKRMKVKNRVFFKTESDALSYGYRPYGHCMYAKYTKWNYSAAQ
ncbi:Ada metal-binding domain-containing protein [Pedobacter agri]|uniref:Metal-binding protein n=1 Tax=Pedobacter agri TaxID=454586 RepID=A0A9X3DA46_9SPHI|nr:Ada metal-binding domain-containing protein [Pedobacter agri]MCX3263557.1 metal-binding protein [Pedobacter agri]